MENGNSANGEALTRTLSREDSLYGDAFASPTKGVDADRIVPIEEDSSASDAAETEAALHRVKEEKIALEKELQSEVAEAEGDANKLKSESDSLNKALQEAERQRKEVEKKFVVEKEKLLGQIGALKEKLIALEEERTEITETKQHNASLQVEIGNNCQTAAVSAAQAMKDMAKKLELEELTRPLKIAYIEEKTDEVEGVVTSPPNWVGNAVAASTGAVAAVVIMSLYLRLRKQQ